MLCQYEVGYMTHQGNRRSENQDSLLLRRGSVGPREFLMLAVADGMGGLANGAEASSQAVQGLDQWWSTQLPELISPELDWEQLEDSLAVAIEAVNWQLCSRSQRISQRSGTTLSLLFLYEGEYRVFQVGDSRGYLLEDGDLRQITRDQTWCQQEIDAGHLTPEEAAVHPRRHVLVSALGVNRDYTLGRSAGRLSYGDSILLCSDGFYQEMDPALLRTWRGPVQELLDTMAAQILTGPASDNLTAILVRMTKGRL